MNGDLGISWDDFVSFGCGFYVLYVLCVVFSSFLCCVVFWVEWVVGSKKLVCVCLLGDGCLISEGLLGLEWEFWGGRERDGQKKRGGGYFGRWYVVGWFGMGWEDISWLEIVWEWRDGLVDWRWDGMGDVGMGYSFRCEERRDSRGDI